MDLDSNRLDLLTSLSKQLKALTDFVESQPSHTQEAFPTAIALSKQLGINREKVKKCLKDLQQVGLIQAISISPKRYRFDSYTFDQLKNTLYEEERSTLYELLSRMDA